MTPHDRTDLIAWRDESVDEALGRATRLYISGQLSLEGFEFRVRRVLELEDNGWFGAQDRSGS